jgi:hypothetical protein
VPPHADGGIAGTQAFGDQGVEQGTHGQKLNRKKTKLPVGVETWCASVTGVGKHSVVHEVVPEPRPLIV